MDRLWEYALVAGSAVLATMITTAVWAYEHPNHLIVAVLLLGVGLLAYDIRRNRTPRSSSEGEEKEMASKRRLAQLQSRFADKIHDFLFEDWINGKISRKEYREYLKTFGNGLGLPDLKTKNWSRNAVRARVIYATQSMKNALANVKAGAIPGPKPGEGVATVSVEPEQEFGSKLLARRNQAKAA